MSNKILLMLKWRLFYGVIKCHNEDWFLCSRGIGDTVLFFAKLETIRKNNPKKKIRIIVSESHYSILKGLWKLGANAGHKRVKSLVFHMIDIVKK